MFVPFNKGERDIVSCSIIIYKWCLFIYGVINLTTVISAAAEVVGKPSFTSTWSKYGKLKMYN